MQAVSLSDARAPLVLAIDIGTSSVRALMFDADGNQIEESESQTSWNLTETEDSGLTADADALVELVCSTIDATLDNAASRTGDIAAVGCSSFWHSMLGLDISQQPCTALYMWIDNRSKADAHQLREDPDLSATMRNETGCRPHSSYWPAKLSWLRRNDPTLIDKVRHWVSFTDYLMYRLTGELTTSICMASGTGLLDIRSCEWHETLAQRFGVDLSSLPPLIDRTESLPPLLDEYRQRWQALASVPWYPALGDGAAANLGSGCVGSDRIAMTIGTSAAMRIIVPAEGPASPVPLWEYRLDQELRVVGGALSNGGNVTRWLANVIASGDIESLSNEASKSGEPDDHGLTWLPFFAGERSPSWNDEAFGSLLGLRFSTTRADIFRAALEGTAYRLAAVYDELKSIAGAIHEIHANGGAALNSPLWMSIIASSFGHSIEAMDADAEVSARGAAISALNAVGELPRLRPATIDSRAMYEPKPDHGPIYAAARTRQTSYEDAVNSVQTRVDANRA